jgi:hypothetical protein
MINLLPATCTPAGQAQFILNDLTADGYIGGQGYYGNVALGTTAAVAGTDVFKNGARYTQTGRLRLYDATSALPAGAVWQGGMPFSSDGQLCIDTGTVTNATYINGKAVGAKGLYAFAYTEFVATPTNLLPAGFSLTRAAPANGTSFDSTGTLVTAAIDSARGTYRWNGSAWVFDGTIVEAAATNLWLQSEVVASWSSFSLNAATQLANQYVAPTGATTVDQITATAGNAQHFVVGANATTGAGTWTVSVYLRYDNHQWVQIHLNDGTNVSAAAFDLQNGVVGAVTGGYTSAITNVGNSLYRCSISGTLAFASASMYLCFLGSNTASPAPNYNAAGTEKFGVWGAQLELGSAATSYIATAAASATRAADVLTAPVSGLLVNGQGFAAIGYRTIAGESTDNECIITTYSGSGGIPLRRVSTALALFDGTANRALGLVLPNVAGTAYKAATTWGGSACNGAVNGVVGTPAAFDGSMDLGATLRIGDNVSALYLPLSMVLQSLRLGLTAASSAQLTTFTT